MPLPTVQQTATTALNDPLKALREVLTGIGDVLSRNVLPPLKNTVKAFEEMGKAFATIFSLSASGSDRLESFATALGAVGKALGSLTGFAIIAGTGIAKLGEQLAGFIKMANPAVFDQFVLVMNDFMAVVGRALVPIFQTLIIPIVRTFADMLMNLAPIGNAVAMALKPLAAVLGAVFEVVGRVLGAVGEIALKLVPVFESLGGVLVEVVKAVQPILDLLVDVIGGALAFAAKYLGEVVKAAAPYVLLFARLIGDLVKFVTDGVRQLLSLIGVNLPDTPGLKPGSSVGAATRQASHSSIEDVFKEAQRSAYSLGTASREDPAMKTASAAEEIKKRTEEIHKAITVDLPNWISSIPARIWDYMKELPKQIADAINPFKSSGGGGGGNDEEGSWLYRHAPSWLGGK